MTAADSNKDGQVSKEELFDFVAKKAIAEANAVWSYQLVILDLRYSPSYKLNLIHKRHKNYTNWEEIE